MIKTARPTPIVLPLPTTKRFMVYSPGSRTLALRGSSLLDDDLGDGAAAQRCRRR
jgi:hypothetical protein